MSDPKQADPARQKSVVIPAFEIDANDLFAEALASMEAREAGATEEEMAEFAADLDVVEEDAASFEGDDIVLPGDDLSDATLEHALDALNTEEVLLADLPTPILQESDQLDFSYLTEEWARLQGEVDSAMARIAELEGQLVAETQRKRRAEAQVRTLRTRVERAETRTKNAMEARAAAEETGRRLRESIAHKEAEMRRFMERRARDAEEQRIRANAPALLELLPVLDHLELAVSHADADPTRINQGVQMIIGQFHAALERLGVERVQAPLGGDFLPEIHEAVMQVDSTDHRSGSIAQTLAPGYRLNGRLLRPARIAVSRGPGPDDSVDADDTIPTDDDTSPEAAVPEAGAVPETAQPSDEQIDTTHEDPEPEPEGPVDPEETNILPDATDESVSHPE